MADFTIFSSKSGLVKIIELLNLVVAMACFFSIHNIGPQDQSASYFVTSMIVSPFLQTSFLFIIYIFGGLTIQKTLYEFMVNCFYTLMILVASIVLFALSNNDPGAVATGIFMLFACVAYAADSYLALVNMGAMSAPAAGPAPEPPITYPPAAPRSQPFTAPPSYIPPPALVGPGLYTLPTNTTNTAGDLGNNRI